MELSTSSVVTSQYVVDVGRSGERQRHAAAEKKAVFVKFLHVIAV